MECALRIAGAGLTKATIVPAYLMAEAIRAADIATMLANPDHKRWYRIGSSADWIQDIDKSDWARTMRAVILDGALLGIVGVTHDRETECIGNILVLRLTPKASGVAFMRACESFADAQLKTCRWLRFTACVDNPAAAGWWRWARKRGGERLGPMRDFARLQDESLADVWMFQVPGGAR